MNTHELALKTYADLQKRKEAKKQNKLDVDAVLFDNVAKVQKTRYRQYYSRGIY